MDIVGVGFIVDGVKDLFPGADRQALQCCAELMDKDRKALAAEITALRKRLAEVEGALEPFAKAADVKLCGEWRDDQRFGHTDVTFHLTFGDLRRARAALRAKGGE